MIRKWFYYLADLAIRLLSADGNKSYKIRGIRFLTAADVKRIFPDCIFNEGRSETHSIPALELGQTAFLLEGAARSPAGLFQGYDVHLEAPFSARFKES